MRMLDRPFRAGIKAWRRVFVMVLNLEEELEDENEVKVEEETE